MTNDDRLEVARFRGAFTVANNSVACRLTTAGDKRKWTTAE